MMRRFLPDRRRLRLFTGSALLFSTVPAAAQTAASGTEPATVSPAPSPPKWIANVSTGLLVRDGDQGRPFLVAGLSRKLGRGYVRVAGTAFKSVVRQIDAALPSDFVLGSLGAGGTFGQWFVDGVVSVGRQHYGGVTTPLGTRASQVGDGSGVFAATLNGGRFVALSHRLYVTPSVSFQYTANRTLRSAIGMGGPQDYETSEHAYTGSGTVRLDRFFGHTNQHVAGVSLSRVQTSNGAVVLASGGSIGGGIANSNAVSVADGWYVVGASGSLRIAPRLWIDMGATHTIDASSGDYDVFSIGGRIGF